MSEQKTYVAIDLKSFYASVECIERGLDPMNNNLLVADSSRTEKTICLAVSPSLKSYGISGRARLFEAVTRIKQVNAERREKAPNRRLTGKSYRQNELNADPTLAVDFLIAPPRMAHYMEYSTRIYNVYLKYVAPEDIVGLAIGTRPDCLPQETVALLREINAVKPVSVELGLQTTNPESVRYIRRGYENEVYFDAVCRLKEAGIEVVTHIILGLPGENAETAARTTADAVAAGTDGVKFHLLHVLRGTDLETDYLAGEFRCLELSEYAQWLKTCLAQVPESVVVHRITGDGAKRDLVAPLWSADKKRVLNYLHNYLKQ